MTRPAPAPPSIGSFVDAFLVELNAAVVDNARNVTGDIENALYQNLASSGDKKKMARQLTTVAKGSNAYMKRVQSAFEKNFAKFELYVRRNIVMVPPEVADRVDTLYQQRLTTTAAATAEAEAAASTQQEDNAHLSPQQRKEKQLEDELRALRQQIRQLEEDTQRLALEQQALETKTEQFKTVASKLEFLEQLPVATITPLKRTVAHVQSLQESLDKMDSVKMALEEDTRTYKRQKLDSRDTFRSLRQRFLARTASVGLASLEDLQKLNATLSGL